MRTATLITLAALLSGCDEAVETLSDAVAPKAVAVVDTTLRVVSLDTDAVSLTIYPENLALVTETRTVTLPAGRSTVQFDGVSDLIIPQTLILREFTGGTLERNFDYDLLGRESLFTESVGETVRLTRIDAGSGKVITDRAEIVSANEQNGVVVRTDDGLEGLFCSGLKTRSSFEGLPPGLAARPAMNVEIETESAGEQTLVISYLTSGMGWEADYRLDLGDAPNLLGWLSMRNGTSKRYEDIDLSVIAGELNRQSDTRGVSLPKLSVANRAACWPLGSTKTGVLTRSRDNFAARNLAFAPPPPPPPVMMEMADGDFDEIVVTGSRVAKAVQEEVGDYKLYRIPRTLTVGAMQTKQLAFLDEPGVETTALYTFEYDQLDEGDTTALSVRYDIDNSREGPLGEPLPEGTIRVFDRSSSGRGVYLGEDTIDNLPVDEDAEVIAGRSTTVFARVGEISEGRNGETAKVTLTNAGDAPAIIEFELPSQWKPRVSGAEKLKEEDTPTWRVEVAPQSSEELTIRRRFD